MTYIVIHNGIAEDIPQQWDGQLIGTCSSQHMSVEDGQSPVASSLLVCLAISSEDNLYTCDEHVYTLLE